MKRLIFLFVLALGILAQTGEREIPMYEGDDNSSHDGQPKWCQRDHDGGFKPNCGECNPPSCDNHGQPLHNNNPKCGVNCRPKACKCHAGCNITGHHHAAPGAEQKAAR
jgi:hypothetical protein